MSSFIRKSVGVLRQYQFGAFKILLNRLLPESFSYHTLLIYCYNLKTKVPDPPSPKPEVTIKKVEGPKDELFQKFRRKFPAQEFVSRINNEKETLYLATKDEEVVAYAWVTENTHHLSSINHTFALNKDEIFLYSCFVTRDHRGEGIHAMLLYERLQDYSQRNKYNMAYVGVLSVNKGSIKGIEKAGFKVYSRIKYVKLFGLERWWGLEKTVPAQ